MKRPRLAVLVPRVKRIAKDNMPMELTSEGDLEPHDPASYDTLFGRTFCRPPFIDSVAGECEVR